MYEKEVVPDRGLPPSGQPTTADRIATYLKQHEDYAKRGIFFPPSAVVLTREEHRLVREFSVDQEGLPQSLQPDILKSY